MIFLELRAGDLFILPDELSGPNEGAKVYMKMTDGTARIISHTNRVAVRDRAKVIKIDRPCISNRIA